MKSPGYDASTALPQDRSMKSSGYEAPDPVEHLAFTDPKPGFGAHSSPQMRTPVLTDAIQLVHLGHVQAADPNRSATFNVVRLAQFEIEAKAKTVPSIGPASSEFDSAGSGFVIRYANADIYYSAATGAHVVRDDIRAKYNAFGAGDGILGLPTTDQSPTADGLFNHFQGGSIYWTSHTGPMVVRGPIRDMWASQGWERSAFRYPIADYIQKPGNPTEFWGGFENGAIYSKDGRAEEAFVVEVDPPTLASLVRKTFDTRFKAADEDLGIEGGVNIVKVSDWGYGFWESTPRTITYEINGFYSIGYPGVVPDPTLRLELKFQFELLWQKGPFTEPQSTDCKPFLAKLNALKKEIEGVEQFLAGPLDKGQHPTKPVPNQKWLKLQERINHATTLLADCNHSNEVSSLTMSDAGKTIVIYLKSWHLSTSGAGNGTLFDELSRRLPDAFPYVMKTVPAEALLVDVLVTPEGGLKFLLAPPSAGPVKGTLPLGKLRCDTFETELNNFVETMLA